MTERLYYDNALLFEFDAQVTACQKTPAGFNIALDRSAFYPTSGGQPHDTGTLETPDGTCISVLNVEADENGEVWHWSPSPLEVGTRVHGSIDDFRRLDHMEQHGGEHMLAGAIWRHLQGVTIGLHTGQEDATIDVTLPDGRVHMTQEEIRLLEADVNGHILENAPVKCFFPSADELKALPLRKAPRVTEHVRVVQMGDFEYCACGGTHPPFTGMIRMVKILSVTPAKGKARVRFVCGARAQNLMSDAYEAAKCASEKLSCRVEKLPDAVKNLQRRLQEKEREKNELAAQIATYAAREAKEKAQLLPGGEKMVTLLLPGGDRNVLVQCASDLIADENTVALCAMPAENGGCTVIFACGKQVKQDMGALMRSAGCRGGGKPDFAQGSAEDTSVLEKAANVLKSEE
ncbi:MAG: hypothetical protein IKT57_01630 [Clostridia bacterium]|nr:hypothetical protein [Clostridia bacterium]